METSTASPHKGFRFPTEIIAHAMWLYHRFPLSVRDVEELRFVRGIVVTYETIRHWCKKFGPAYANQLRRRRARPADIWPLDAVWLKSTLSSTTSGGRSIKRATYWTAWSSSRRNKAAAKKVFRKLRKGCTTVPRVIITDKLASSGAAPEAYAW